MNDLFLGSFSRFRSKDQSPPHHHNIEMTADNFPTTTGGVNLDKVFEDVESIKEELKELETLDRNNAANRSLPGCGSGSSSDCTRTSVVNGLRKKLFDSMNSFNTLRQNMTSEYRETMQWRYFTVTGENAYELMVDKLIEMGQSETFLHKVIQPYRSKGGGRGWIR